MFLLRGYIEDSPHVSGRIARTDGDTNRIERSTSAVQLGVSANALFIQPTWHHSSAPNRDLRVRLSVSYADEFKLGSMLRGWARRLDYASPRA